MDRWANAPAFWLGQPACCLQTIGWKFATFCSILPTPVHPLPRAQVARLPTITVKVVISSRNFSILSWREQRPGRGFFAFCNFRHWQSGNSTQLCKGSRSIAKQCHGLMAHISLVNPCRMLGMFVCPRTCTSAILFVLHTSNPMPARKNQCAA